MGFGKFVDFNGGTLQDYQEACLHLAYDFAPGSREGLSDTNGFNSTFSGNIINSGSLTKIGSGTLTLSGNNTYSGGTNILGGVLSVSADTNLGTGSINMFNSAELLTTGVIFISGKAIALSSGGGKLASLTGAFAKYGGDISGSGALSVGDTSNAGTILLTGDNTYSGGTVLNAGTLVVGSAQALGIGDVIVNGGVLKS